MEVFESQAEREGLLEPSLPSVGQLKRRCRRRSTQVQQRQNEQRNELKRSRTGIAHLLTIELAVAVAVALEQRAGGIREQARRWPMRAHGRSGGRATARRRRTSSQRSPCYVVDAAAVCRFRVCFLPFFRIIESVKVETRCGWRSVNEQAKAMDVQDVQQTMLDALLLT